MKCLVCKNGVMEKSTDTYFAKTESGYIIIENVPCMKCDQCGEVVYSADVLERIETLLAQMKNTVKLCIVDYREAA